MTETALVQKEENIVEWMMKNKKSLERGLPRNTLTMDRFAQVFMTTFRNGSDALKLSTKSSLLHAIMQSVNMGFEVGGPLGQCYMVPFKNNKLNPPQPEVQLIIGYQGWMDLVYRSGLVSDIDATCVFEGDEFEYERGLTPSLRHVDKAEFDKRKKENMTHVYAIVRYRDASILPKFEVLTINDVNRFRNLSKAANGDAWTKFFLEMAKKTAIARVLKYVRKTPELAAGMAVEENQYGGPRPTIDIDVQIDEPEQIAEQPKADAMADKIQAQREEQKKNEAVNDTTGEITEETPSEGKTVEPERSTSEGNTGNGDKTDEGGTDGLQANAVESPELGLTPPADDVPPPMSREDKWEHVKQLLADKEPKAKVGKNDHSKIEGLILNLDLNDVPDKRLNEMIDVLTAMPDKGKRKSPGKAVVSGEK